MRGAASWQNAGRGSRHPTRAPAPDGRRPGDGRPHPSGRALPPRRQPRGGSVLPAAAGHRVAAAVDQGRGDDLRPAVRALPGRRPDAGAAARPRRGDAARRRPQRQQDAVRARPGVARPRRPARPGGARHLRRRRRRWRPSPTSSASAPGRRRSSCSSSSTVPTSCRWATWDCSRRCSAVYRLRGAADAGASAEAGRGVAAAPIGGRLVPVAQPRVETLGSWVLGIVA